MATLFVDKIDPQSGTSLSLGSSGDTVALTSGVKQNNMLYPTFKASRSSNLNIANNSDVKITFNTEDWDTDSAFADNKFTVPSGFAGKYFFNFVTRIRDGGNVDLELSFFKNGSKEDRMSFFHNGSSEQYQSYGFTTVMDLSVSDYIEFFIYHNAGGNLEINGGSVTFFQGFRIGT